MFCDIQLVHFAKPAPFASAPQTLCTFCRPILIYTHLVKPTKRITERVPNRQSLSMFERQIGDGSTSTKSTHVGSPIIKPSPIEGYYWVYPHYHIWGTSSNRHLNSRSQRRRQSPAGALARSLHSTSQMTKQHAKNGFKGGFLMNKVRILGEGFN